MSSHRDSSQWADLSRRDMLRLSWAGLVGASTLPWLEAMADDAAPPARASGPASCCG